MSQQHPIAVVGVGGLFPGSVSAAKFWANIIGGVELITDIPESHFSLKDYYDPDLSAPDKTYARRGGFLPEVPFDTLGFGIPPNLLASTDTSQLLALLVARTTLEDAFQGGLQSADKSRISCLLGVTSGQELFGSMASRLRRPEWIAGMRAAGIDEETAQKAADKISSCFAPWTESTFPGLLGNVVAGRIANRLDLGGTNAVCDAACASSFAALSMGLDELTLGRADVVLAGGVDTLNDIFMHMCFSKTPALSMSGNCRPFDKDGDGTLLGEGLGMFALKRLEDAERDQNRIYAVIRGLGTSSDGRSKSVYAPVSEGQAKAIVRAYEVAGYGADSVELVEAHGTGTRAGDVAEIGGLKMAFDQSGRKDRQWCALGSVKSQIGHTKSAAGAAGLMKAVLSLHDRVLPPTVGVREPNPGADLPNSPFFINTEARPWVRKSDHPRRASVSSFGFGGSNFHVVVEEYTGPGKKPGRIAARPAELVAVSGSTKAAVAERAAQVATSLGTDGTELLAVAAEAAGAFKATDACRLLVVAKDAADGKFQLEKAAAFLHKGENPTGPAFAYGEGATPGKVAFLFPGQGSQYVNMAADLALAFPRALDALDAAEDVELEAAETTLSRRMFPPSAFNDNDRGAQSDALKATEWAQPALGAAELAALAVLDEVGVKPDVVGGHSFGELTALYAAGSISKQDLIQLARKRGLLMKQAAVARANGSGGAMAAITSSPEKIREVLGALDGPVVIANENAPQQTVIAGPSTAVEDALARLEKAGLRGKKLEVATAFHSPLVADAVPALEAFLGGISVEKGRIPVYANATAAPYPAESAAMKKLLASQVGKGVKFVDEVRAMYDAGARIFVEVGPGAVLTGLVGRILEGKPHLATATDAKGAGAGVRAFLLGLARLGAAGVPLDLAALFNGREHDPRPPKGKLDVAVGGANLGKPKRPAPAPVTANVAPAAAPAPTARPAPAAAGGGLGAASGSALTSAKPASSATMAAPAAQRSAQAGSSASAPAPSPASAALVSAPRPGPSPSALAAAPLEAFLMDSPRSRANGALPSSSRAAEPASVTQPSAPAGWLEVFREGQRQTADAHQAFQNALADTHVAFLQAFETSNANLASLLAGAPALPAAPVRQALPAAAAPAAPAMASLQAQAPSAPAFAPAAVPGVHAPLGSPGASTAAQARPAPAARPAAAAPAALTAAPAGGLTAVFLEVVAEKTGYPKDALELDMELEADLGIDSIKRVEILSAIKQRAPGLPELDPMQASQLRTLRAITEAYGAGATAAPAATPVAPAAAPASGGASAAKAAKGSPARDLSSVFLGIVAEKTGYPLEALELDMELEADLGIDSIKRVEILSALDEAVDDMPNLDAMHAAKLGTLRAIIEAIGGAGAPAGAPAAAPAAAAAPASKAASAGGAPSGNVVQVFLDVVADKTGYPKDALDLDMELEADLGIDSIKRVEILSALKEAAPELPDLDAMHASQLRTLRAIADALVGAAGGAPSASAASAAPSAATENGAHAAPNGAAEEGGLPARAVVTWEESPLGKGRRPPLPEGRVVAVRTPNPALTKQLTNRLNAAGLKAEALEEGPLNGLADKIGGLVVVAGGFDDAVEALGDLKRAFFDVQRCSPSLASSAEGGAAFVLGVSRYDPAAPRASATSGGLAGLMKTAALEWPKVRCESLDVDAGSADDLADAILEEIEGGVDTVEVRRRRGARLVPVLVVADDPPSPRTPSARPVAVVTGGARGVTAACLIRWAEVAKPRVVLLGRTALTPEPPGLEGAESEGDLVKALFEVFKARGDKPTPAVVRGEAKSILAVREIAGTIRALEQAGAEVLYVATDASDKASLKKALGEARAKLGPIQVLVHGAGVIADKKIDEKTADQVDRVLDTKAFGALQLLELTQDDPIEAISFFSSVAGVTGNIGQSDYAMANEVLARLAEVEAAARPGAAVNALAWGPWDGGMVTPELRAHFKARGVPLIPLDGGAEVFTRELGGRGPGGPTTVVVGATLDGLAPDKRIIRLRLAGSRLGLLDDHRIRGGAVLPAALGAELMLEAGRRVLGQRPAELDDLNVLRGVRLGEGPLPDHLDVEIDVEKVSGEWITTLRLPGDKGPRYRGRLVAPKPGQDSLHGLAAPALTPAGATRDGPLYDDAKGPGRLFHGPAFHVVDRVVGSDEQGMLADVRGRKARGWPDDRWQLDAAAVDAGLQLLLLFGEDRHGHGYLPTHVDRVIGGGTALGGLRCLLVAKEHSPDKVVADLWFIDESGACPLALLGAVAHRIPDVLRPAERPSAP